MPGPDDLPLRLRLGGDVLAARVVLDRTTAAGRELVVSVADPAQARALAEHAGALVLERGDERGVVELPVVPSAARIEAPGWVALHVPTGGREVVRQRRRWARAPLSLPVELETLAGTDDARTASDEAPAGAPAEPSASSAEGQALQTLDVSGCGVRWRPGQGLAVGDRVHVRLHLDDGPIEGDGTVVRAGDPASPRPDLTEAAADVAFAPADAERLAAAVFRAQRDARRRRRS